MCGGARASCRRARDWHGALAAEEPAARTAGAHEVVLNNQGLVAGVKALAPDGVDHIVEVAFGANIDADVEMLKMGGSIGAYATDNCDAQNPVLADGVQEHPRVFARERRFSDGGQGGGDAGFERCASGGLGRVRNR